MVDEKLANREILSNFGHLRFQNIIKKNLILLNANFKFLIYLQN